MHFHPPYARGTSFWSRSGTPKRKQKGLVPTRINSVGIVDPNKAIATHRSLPNLHAFFSQRWGRNRFYYFCFVSLLACAWCMKAKIAVPVLRSLSLYCDGLLKFHHNDIFILVTIQNGPSTSKGVKCDLRLSIF